MPPVPSRSGSSLPVADTTALVSNSGAYAGLKASAITSGQTRYVTVPDQDMDLRDLLTEPGNRPASANTLDDEFDGTSLNAKWSWNNQGSATAVIAGGCLKLTSATGTNGTTHNLHSIVQTKDLTSGNWRCWARVGLRSDQTAYHVSTDFMRAGIVMADSSSGRAEALFITHNSSINGTAPNTAILAARYASATSLNAGIAQRAIVFGRCMYLMLMKVGTTIYASYSIDGCEYLSLTTWTQTTYVAAPDRIGVCVDALNASSYKAVSLLPFFRFETL